MKCRRNLPCSLLLWGAAGTLLLSGTVARAKVVQVDEILLELSPAKAVAVPFDHDISGEELALVIQADRSQNITADSLKALFRDRFPEEDHPKIALLTTQPVRTESGKASRWQFTPRFEEYRGKIFGRGTLVRDER